MPDILVHFMSPKEQAHRHIRQEFVRLSIRGLYKINKLIKITGRHITQVHTVWYYENINCNHRHKNPYFTG
jgi:hypothetical protein